MAMDDRPPWAALLYTARKRQGLSVRRVAAMAAMTEGRWRQIENGYQSMGAGQRASVRGPADTIARMAQAVGVTEAQLRGAGRDDAADELRRLGAPDLDDKVRATAGPLRKLIDIRQDIDRVIDDLRRGGLA